MSLDLRFAGLEVAEARLMDASTKVINHYTIPGTLRIENNTSLARREHVYIMLENKGDDEG